MPKPERPASLTKRSRRKLRRVVTTAAELRAAILNLADLLEEDDPQTAAWLRERAGDVQFLQDGAARCLIEEADALP